MTAETELSVARMCTLAGFSRAGYYRSLNPAPAWSADDLELRDAMHEIAAEWPAWLGRTVSDEETISINAYRPDAGPDDLKQQRLRHDIVGRPTRSARARGM